MVPETTMGSAGKVVHLDEVRRAALGRASRDGEEARRLREPSPDEDDLVRGLRDGKSWAERALLERYGGHVERVLTHILGNHTDLDDLAQEVFLRALERIGDLREAHALKDWLSAFAANVAREAIRRKRRRWWQVLRPPEETPEIPAPCASPEDRAALRAFYEVLGAIDTDARIAFTLRYVEGMELTQIARACDASLATIKRRIKRAEVELRARGRAHEALADWFQEGSRWADPTS
ncbi:RNA polymerase sigma factor RpoE [Minicystis rosea]|nr:RNA polymerase sigma factor RpoE [Minicystis rosea]